MSVLGYETGPVACEAAFIADFDVDRSIPVPALVSKIDSDRRIMALQPGMRSKYVPFRFDPATGAHQIGGRYLFDTWANVQDYMRFTTEELEFEPGIKFWKRPFFANIDKGAWHVVGAQEFMPLATHYASRFERFGCASDATPQDLEAAWPNLCDATRDGLAAVWLLVRPDRREVALLSVAVQDSTADEAERASRSLLALERMTSLSSRLPKRYTARTLFDRSSLNLAIWLPRSEVLGGVASLFPTYPTHPRPVCSER